MGATGLVRGPLGESLHVCVDMQQLFAADGPWAIPWMDKVVATAPDTDVFHCQSFIVLPVARAAAQRVHGRFVYDVADLYKTEVTIPAAFRAAAEGLDGLERRVRLGMPRPVCVDSAAHKDYSGYSDCAGGPLSRNDRGW